MTTPTLPNSSPPVSRSALWRRLRASLAITGIFLVLLAAAGAVRAAEAKPTGAPVNTQPPSVSGQTVDGEELTASKGGWSGGVPITHAYEWERCDSSGANCSAIDGATRETYLLHTIDVGARLRVAVTAQNDDGTATAESAPTAVISSAAPVNVSLPTISGVTEVGQTLTGQEGGWIGSPTIAYGWQWLRCDSSGANCADIPGATAASYQLSPDDEGNSLRLRVTGENAAGSGYAESVATGRVGPAGGPPPSNAVPQAGFVFFPAHPLVGERVDLVSISSDPDGPLSEQQWDLDGDGQFGDGSGTQSAYAFGSAGPHTVSLRVVDQGGAADVKSQVIDVSAAPGSPTTAGLAQAAGPLPGLPQLLAITPFPVVRIVGQVTNSGVRIRLVSIRAPRGASVVVRCRGRLCPARRVGTRVGSRRLRLRRLEGMLGAGARLELFVRQPGRVGKYTRFRSRAGKLPARLDACLLPGAAKPTPCQGA